jgi:hypothetical protein
MNLFITLLENVNKSRTSANNVSLNIFCSMFKSHVTQHMIYEPVKVAFKFIFKSGFDSPGTGTGQKT